ncbi:MAG TPA: glycoside hydrolase family 3 N-terminal domain-containing protein [Ktedonobacterales bacterium]
MRTSRHAETGRRSVRHRCRAVVQIMLLAALALLSACGATASQPRLAQLDPAAYTASGRLASMEPSLTVLANAYLARMSLDEKLGQLFVVEFVGPAYTPDNAAMVEELHAGGVLVYNREMPTFQAAHDLLAAAQAHATIPLFTVVDEEGGWVDRMQDVYGFRPSASMIAATGSTDYAYAQARQVARDMRSLGLNFDLAPDVDVALVNGPDQSTRTFGSTPDVVTAFGGAYLTGLQHNGVIGCLKHFPGLGAATSDAHLGLPVISRTHDQIEQVELAPYRTLIQTEHPGCVMSTDLLMPAIDPALPAELSYKTITGVLRQELGYDGVVVTDALYMEGIKRQFSMPQAGVMAIQAGCDFLMGPWDPDQTRAMIAALKAALASGQISMARIDQSVLRLLKLKLQYGILPPTPPTVGVGPTAARPVQARDMALASIAR